MQLFALLKAVPVVVSAVHAATELYEWAEKKYDDLTREDAESADAEQKVAKPRKKSDTTRLTQHQYDFVLYAREQWEAYNRDANPGERKNLQDLTDMINCKLNLNKSSSAYNRVWNGTIKRDQLPTGNQLSFEFGEDS